MTTLWESLSAPWRGCVELAWAAYCKGSLPIGAVIADREGKLIARGRNLGAFNDPSPHALARSSVGHAEIVALGTVKRPRTVLGCVIYCSAEPCPMCAGAIGISGLAEVRYASRDPTGGGIGLLLARRRQFPAAVRVREPESELLDVLLGALLLERTLEWWRNAKADTGPLRKSRPRAAAFAAWLAKRGILSRYARARAPAEGVLNTLEREFARRDWKPSA